MATDAPKLEAISHLAAKAETTTGTAIAVAAAEAAFIVFNLEMNGDEPENERQAMAGKGRLASAPGAQSGSCSFEIELTGNGSAGLPLWASTFLPACDWEVSTATYSAANGVTTLTLVVYEDGLRRELTGARGNFRLILEAGKPGRVRFEFKGKYHATAVTDAAILSVTYPTVLAPVFAGATVSIAGAFTPTLSRIEIDAGNDVQMREDATAADASGFKAAFIPNRKTTGSMDPEAVAVATRDWRSKLFGRNEESLSIVVGSSANNIITIAAAKFQTIKAPRGKRNGLLTDAIGFALNGTSPFTIAFS